MTFFVVTTKVFPIDQILRERETLYSSRCVMTLFYSFSFLYIEHYCWVYSSIFIVTLRMGKPTRLFVTLKRHCLVAIDGKTVVPISRRKTVTTGSTGDVTVWPTVVRRGHSCTEVTTTTKNSTRRDYTGKQTKRKTYISVTVGYLVIFTPVLIFPFLSFT